LARLLFEVGGTLGNYLPLALGNEDIGEPVSHLCPQFDRAQDTRALEPSEGLKAACPALPHHGSIQEPVFKGLACVWVFAP
jgi:hypothetical protein